MTDEQQEQAEQAGQAEPGPAEEPSEEPTDAHEEGRSFLDPDDPNRAEAERETKDPENGGA
jgi:hypothetical protein